MPRKATKLSVLTGPVPTDPEELEVFRENYLAATKIRNKLDDIREKKKLAKAKREWDEGHKYMADQRHAHYLNQIREQEWRREFNIWDMTLKPIVDPRQRTFVPPPYPEPPIPKTEFNRYEIRFSNDSDRIFLLFVHRPYPGDTWKQRVWYASYWSVDNTWTKWREVV